MTRSRTFLVNYPSELLQFSRFFLSPSFFLDFTADSSVASHLANQHLQCSAKSDH
jgi:hypothetical protein